MTEYPASVVQQVARDSSIKPTTEIHLAKSLGGIRLPIYRMALNRIGVFWVGALRFVSMAIVIS